MSRLRNKIAVGLFIFFGCFLVIVPGFFLSLGTQPVQNIVQKKISGLLPGTIAWETLKLSFLSPGIDLKGLKVSGPDGRQVLHADQIFAKFNLSRLFRRELNFSTVKLDGLSLFLEINEQGQLNIIRAFADPSAGVEEQQPPDEGSAQALFNVKIRQLEFNTVHVKIDIPHEKKQMVLEQLDLLVTDLDVENKSGSLDLELLNTKVHLAQAGHLIDRIRVKAELKSSLLGLSECSLVSGKTGLNASGVIKDPFGTPVSDIDIRADILAQQAMDIMSLQIPASGFVSATAKISGTLENPVARFDLFSDALTTFDHPLDIQSRIELKDNQVNIVTLEARAKSSMVHGSGTYQLKTRQLDAQFDLNAQDINDFTVLAGIPSRGRLSVEGNIFGKADNPNLGMDFSGDTLRVEGIELDQISGKATFKDRSGLPEGKCTIKSTGLMVKGVRVGDLAADAVFSNGVVRINRLSVKNNQSAVDFSGNIKVFDPGTKKRLDSPDLDIVLSGDQILLGDFFNAYSGTLSVSGAAKGKLPSLLGHINLAGQKIHVNQFEVGSLDLRLDSRGGAVKPELDGHLTARDILTFQEKTAPLDLKINMKDNQIFAKGSMGFKIDAACNLDNRFLNATLSMKALALSPYFKMAGQKDLSGTATGAITAKGFLDNLQHSHVTANLSDLSVFYKQKTAIETQKIDLSMEKGSWVLPQTHLRLFEKGTARVKGQGTLPEKIKIEIDTTLSLETIDPMVEQIDQATGIITLNAQIDGSVKDPKMSASVHLDNLGMSVSYIGGQFKQINGSIELTQDLVQINRISGFLDDGEFWVDGRMGIKDWGVESGDVIFEARSLPVDLPDVMNLKINSKLALKTNQGESRLFGNIVLLEGLYYKDVKLDIKSLTRQKRPTSPRSENPKPLFLEKTDVNINITRQEPFLVENNLAMLHISPDLQIHGTAATPLISGRAQIDSGTITFQKKEFEVTKGVIDFANPYKIEPTIDMEGVVDVRNWTIVLSVSGTPDNLDFNFTSTPSEEHADILSLLAFGKTTRELRSAQGGSSFSPAQILAGFVAETMQENLKDVSGLDHVDMGVSDDGAKMMLGKDLSRQLTVKYGLDVRAEKTVQQVITDYKILEVLLLSGYQDTDGDFGGGLKLRMEFR